MTNDDEKYLYDEVKVEVIEKMLRAADESSEYIAYTNKKGAIDMWLKRAEEGLNDFELAGLRHDLTTRLEEGLYKITDLNIQRVMDEDRDWHIADAAASEEHIVKSEDETIEGR